MPKGCAIRLFIRLSCDILDESESGGATLMTNLNGGGIEVKNTEMAALARLIHYSEEEALRLGVSGIVIECLRMANIELTSAIANGAGLSVEDAEAVRMN
jgi:hypothetical protein